jgi:signal transduction histidine kinase
MLECGALGTMPAEARKPIKLARRNCERLMRIVNDLLDLTNIGRGSFDLQLQSVELEPILWQAVESRQVVPEARVITFAVTDRAKGARVAADPPRLQQVLDNLLTNAAKFSDAKNAIDVQVDRHAECIRVAVTDRGIGIAPDHYDEVFKPFMQVDSSSTRAQGGAGLGLTIARAIVEAHHGTIGFSSKESEGTTFYFDLPAETVT